MFAKTKSVLMLAIFSTAAIACGGATQADDPEPARPDFTAGFSTEGLTLDEKTSDHVAGAFVREGASVRFTIDRDGEKRTLTVVRDSGEPLLASTFESGVDTISFAGGKAVLTGAIGAEPTKQGDPLAFEAVTRSFDPKLLPELKEALVASHIDRDLLYPSANSVAPQSWYDGTYWHLAYGETFGFWSWSFWGWTTVVIASEQNPSYGYAAAWFRAGAASPEYVGGWGMQSYRRQWWGAYVTVGNNLLPLCGTWGCQNTTMIARSY